MGILATIRHRRAIFIFKRMESSTNQKPNHSVENFKKWFKNSTDIDWLTLEPFRTRVGNPLMEPRNHIPRKVSVCEEGLEGIPASF